MLLNNLINHKGFKRYFSNISWLLVDKILQIFVLLFVGALVARYLGPERFGLLCYARSFVALFSVIAFLGLDGIVVRELVKNSARRDLLLGTAFVLKITGAIFTIVIIVTAMQFTGSDALTKSIIFIITCRIIFNSFNVIAFYFQSKVLSKYIAYVNMFSLIFLSAIKIALIFYKASLIAFALLILFGNILLALGYLYIYKRQKLKIAYWNFDINEAKNLLADSWPLILSGIVISVYMRIDQVMIKEMLDARAVGLYAAAVRISVAWYFIPVVIINSLFPAIVNAKKVSKELYYRRLQKLYDLMAFFALFVGILIFIGSNFIISTLFGEHYHQASSILKIHVFCGILTSVGIVRGRWMLIENLQKYGLFIHVIGAITNILFNLYFINTFGVIGAAIGTLLSYFITLFFSSLIIKNIRISFFMILKAYLNVFTLKSLREGFENA